MSALLGRLLLFAVAPERAWRSDETSGGAAAATARLALAALVPAATAALLTVPEASAGGSAMTPLGSGSPYGDALGSLDHGLPFVAVSGPALSAILAAGLAYLGVWMAIALGAIVLALLAPLFDARLTPARVWMLAANAALPLLLGSCILLHPALIPVIALAAMQSFYVAWLGLARLGGLAADDAGVALAMMTLTALIGSQCLGYGLGLVQTLLGW